MVTNASFEDTHETMLAIVADGSLFGGSAVANTQATGSVAYRQHSMTSMAEHMATLKLVLTEQPRLIVEVGADAAAIAATSAFTPGNFPKDDSLRQQCCTTQRAGPAGRLRRGGQAR
ncbi:MAG: hypothetical protein WAS21_19200 [Geminicoccaceae bacterium]